MADDTSDEATGRKGNQLGWLVLVYRIPSEPTRLRATVWRRLKALGAVYLQNSIAALPMSAPAERSMRKLQHDIVEMAGTATLMRSTVLVGEATVIAAFQDARRDEYEEVVDRCRGFMTEVEHEYEKQHFSYAELEENEVDFTKLVNWLEKIRQRDVFGAPGRAEAEAELQKCEQALEDYAARVYAEEPEGH